MMFQPAPLPRQGSVSTTMLCAIRIPRYNRVLLCLSPPSLFPSCCSPPPTLVTHSMSYPSNESVVTLKNGNSNGINLLPTLPTFIRDARYQGGTRVKLTSTIISLGAHFSPACACFISLCMRPSMTHSAQGHRIDPKDGRCPFTQRASDMPTIT
jgi:hypothetical protein